MTTDASRLDALVEAELSLISDQRVIDHIRSLRVPARPVLRPWDYGRLDEAYPCWEVLNHEPSRTGIAYCEYGFGPRSPWGLVFLDPADNPPSSMGMDCSWYAGLLDAYFESRASSDLPIWRVARGRSGPREFLTAEAGWDETWREVNKLRQETPDGSFHCDHSIAYPSQDLDLE